MDYDAATGEITVPDYLYVLEGSQPINGWACYGYQYGITITKGEPAVPEVVELPEGVKPEEYTMYYFNEDESSSAKIVNVAVDGNDVYVQGFSDYIPEAWVKGTMDGEQVTFPAMQYLGDYSANASSFAFYNGEAVFTYDAEADTYTAEGEIYGVLADKYFDGRYFDPVIKKVAEKAIMPANPSITALENGDYGWYFTFNVPVMDINGDALAISKLSYMIYTDVEGEIAPLTFTSATHTRLTEDMTEIPYGFTENYDFYDSQIYLNDLYSSDWNKLGIQSIYYGGGETNATEIQWYDIKDNGGSEGGTVWVASEAGYGNGDEVTEIKFDDYTTGLLDKAEGKNSPKYYDSGTSVRMYAGNTLTISSEKKIEKIVFTFDTSKTPAFEVNEGKYDNDSYTWSGEASEIVFTVPNVSGQQNRIQQIEITYGTPADPDPNHDVLVELPDGVEAESWTLEGVYGTSYGYGDQQIETEVAFDGNDIYVKGLAYYFEDSWVKGTIENGIAIFPSGQFVGEDEYGKEYMIGVDVIEGVDDDEYVITDFQYAYDAEAKKLTQITPFVMENGDTYEEIAPWGYWLYSYFYAGEPIVLEPVQAPEGLETEAYYFTASVSEESEEEEGVYEMVPYSNEVKVGFDGDDVYIQGLAEDYPEGWVKATKNRGQYVIPANQYMGTLVIGSYQFPYYLTAVDDNLEFADMVLDFDEATNTFSTNQMLILNGSRFILYPYLTYEEATASKVVEMAGVPADPSITGYKLEETNYPNISFDIPLEDTDGNPMLTDKLFYTVWVEKDGKEQPYTVLASEYTYVEEDMTEIPYNYADSWDIYRGGKTFYFNPVEEVADFTNIGIQTIYYGGDECNKTQIIWMDGSVTTGIKDINTANNTAVYYDLQGRKVNAPQKGLFIKQTRQDNGAVKTVKTVRK